jgi:hypothetical protein
VVTAVETILHRFFEKVKDGSAEPSPYYLSMAEDFRLVVETAFRLILPEAGLLFSVFSSMV